MLPAQPYNSSLLTRRSHAGRFYESSFHMRSARALYNFK